jgi:integrase/recombinase XerD
MKIKPVRKPSKAKRSSRPKKIIKNIDGFKYFTEKQVKMIRRTVRDQAELDHGKGKVTGIREWMVIDILTSTGVRVTESSNIRCGDCKIGYSESEIFVRDGKGSV